MLAREFVQIQCARRTVFAKETFESMLCGRQLPEMFFFVTNALCVICSSAVIARDRYAAGGIRW